MKYVVNDEKIRLDKYLVNILNDSRSNITKQLKNETILVNGLKANPSYMVKCNDEITVLEKKEVANSILKKEMNIDIVFENDNVILINKESGISVHPGAGNKNNTLVNGLMYYTSNLSDLSGENRLGIVHRIDKDTSGLLLVCKTNEAHRCLANDFKNKAVKREYIALLVGEFPHQSATVDAPIGRDVKNRLAFTVCANNSKKAITHIYVLKRFVGYTLVKCILETGRTHQIRVHMKYIGYPIYNDPIYTTKNATSFGQFLHSSKITFTEPITKEVISKEVPLPKYFQDFIDNLEPTKEID